MASAVDASENAMRCRIPVLISTKVIVKGEPLNRFVERIKAPAGSKDIAPSLVSWLALRPSEERYGKLEIACHLALHEAPAETIVTLDNGSVAVIRLVDAELHSDPHVLL